MTIALALGLSVSLNLVLWIRSALVSWRYEQDVESAYRQGRREGWFDAARHLPVDRDRPSNHFLN